MIHPGRSRVSPIPRRALVAAALATCLGAASIRSERHSATGADEPPAAAPPSVEVFGTVVDADTGEPVEGFITQAGKFDPQDPQNVTWGYSESRTSSSSYSATIRWAEGWTARILAEGYLPHPLFDKAPPAGKDRIERVIRLKKGRAVRGQVVDHRGEPVEGATVFAIRSIQLTLAGGKAVNSYDGEADPTIRGVRTDKQGRFELTLSDPPPADPPADERTSSEQEQPAQAVHWPGLVVSSPTLDAWPAPLPEADEEAVIRLPPPTRVEIEYDIEGSEDEATVFLQSVMHEVPAWKGFEIIRRIPVRNQGRVEIESLPPGRYQFARSRMLQHGSLGHGQFLDRQYIVVADEGTTEVSFARKSGARVKGTVEWDAETRLTGVIISVRKQAATDEVAGRQLFPDYLDARLLRVAGEAGSQDGPGVKPEIIGHRGLFLTERLPPGDYEIHAEGYAPLTPEQQVRTGVIGPTVTAQQTVTVPESGVVPTLKLDLKKPPESTTRRRRSMD